MHNSNHNRHERYSPEHPKDQRYTGRRRRRNKAISNERLINVRTYVYRFYQFTTYRDWTAIFAIVFSCLTAVVIFNPTGGAFAQVLVGEFTDIGSEVALCGDKTTCEGAEEDC